MTHGNGDGGHHRCEDSPEAIAACLNCKMEDCHPEREQCGLKKLETVRVPRARRIQQQACQDDEMDERYIGW